MTPIYVILYPGTTGGTGTLSIRLGGDLVRRGHQVLFVCRELTDVDNAQLMEKVGIKVICVGNRNICSYLLKEYGRDSSFIFLTYRLNEYFLVERFRRTLDVTKSLLYVVHHYGLIQDSTYSVLRELRRKFYRGVIAKMLNHQSIIFMDFRSLEETQKYYNIDIEGNQSVVFHLPMKVEEHDDAKIAHKLTLETFNLLTIARAEFPFKGYIIGLIDDFGTLCASYDNLTLTIISFGEHQNQIVEKINELPDAVRMKVNLIGQTPYSDLPAYFGKTHVYLGMGTTILDAVNNGVPSIVMQPYTYECNSSGFFHQQPELLASYEGLSPSIYYTELVINMSIPEYIELCDTERQALEKHYDSETIITYLTDIERKREVGVVTDFELIKHKCLSDFFAMAKELKTISSKKPFCR